MGRYALRVASNLRKREPKIDSPSEAEFQAHHQKISRGIVIPAGGYEVHLPGCFRDVGWHCRSVEHEDTLIRGGQGRARDNRCHLSGVGVVEVNEPLPWQRFLAGARPIRAKA